MTDIEIARASKMLKIDDIADKLNINREYLEHYGKYKAKINLDILKRNLNLEKSNFIWVGFFYYYYIK